MHTLQATASSSLSLPPGTYIYAIAATSPSSSSGTQHQQQFAAISSDDSLRLFDGHSLQPTSIVAAKSHDGVTALKEYGGIAPAGFLLATAGRDGAVRLWDARAGSSQRASVEMRVGMYSLFLFVSFSM
jgi:WD40 repeat protein